MTGLCRKASRVLYNFEDVRIRKVFTCKTFKDEKTCFELLQAKFREFGIENEVKWSNDDQFRILIDVKEKSESVAGFTIRGITNP